jgi:hypothetical protein
MNPEYLESWEEEFEKAEENISRPRNKNLSPDESSRRKKDRRGPKSHRKKSRSNQSYSLF